MSVKRIARVVVMLAVVLCLGVVPGESQLASRGTYQATFWWHEQGEWFEVEKGHMFFTGKVTGTFFNDAGSGFLHRADAVCPGGRDVFTDSVVAHGYCVITDEDDDKAVLVWSCKDQQKWHCDGTAEWMTGTGKYTGLEGL